MNERPDQIEISTTQAMHRARALKRLRRPLRLTRLGMVAERVTRAFWPFWSWAFLIWTAMSFRLLDSLSVELAWALIVVAGAGLLVFGTLGVRRFRWPGLDEAADRLDRSLKGRPLTALWDRQAVGAGDSASASLWRAHVARMAEIAAGARPVQPDLKISSRDPYGLRYATLTALVVALLFGVTAREALKSPVPGLGTAEAMPTGPLYEIWLEPPRYTGLPTIYLNEVASGTTVSIPVGSRATVRLYGETGALGLIADVADAAAIEDATRPDARDFTVARSGTISITGGTGDAPAWRIAVIDDLAPKVSLTGPAERTPEGAMQVPFEASDDYAVASGRAVLSLDLDAVDRRMGLALAPEDQPEITLDLPMPFAGDRSAFSDMVVGDLAKHPWSGLPVTLTVSVLDDIGQEGRAEMVRMDLPGRRFFDPLARAVVEQRRDLLWNRENGPRVAQVLRAVSWKPDEVFDDMGAYLTLRSAIRRLEYARGGVPDGALRDEVAEMLWQVALKIEDGDLSDAEARLKRAQDRLADAIENGATDEEIRELMEELRRAMQDYMEKLAQEAERNPPSEQAMGEMETITQDQLQQMLDEIERLMKEGRTEEAMALLEQLRQMMENMQTARRQEGQGEGQQQMQGMQDMLRQQQDLSDDSFRRLQEEFNGQTQPGNRPPSGRPGQGTNDDGQAQRAPSPGELARRQEQLRELLESRRGELPDGDTEAGRAAREALRRAEREMGEARDSLNQGDLPRALENQADALEALREGIENLGREMARNQNQNQGRQGDQAGSPDPNAERDPLGRQTGTVGRLGSDDEMLNGVDPVKRSRELLDEIRRRSGERGRPKIELDYLERLLDRF